MTQFIKTPANKSGPYSFSNNILNLEIPSDSMFDLNDSYIEIMSQIDDFEADTATGVGAYSLSLGWTDGNNGPSASFFQNTGLVKNCSFVSAKKGRLENIRAVDVLRTNLYSYTKSQLEIANDNYLNGAVVLDPLYRNRYGIYLNAQRLGNIRSTMNNQIPITIRLGDLMESCRVSKFNTYRAGKCTITLELNINKLQVFQQLDNGQDQLNDDAMAQGVDYTQVGAGIGMQSVIIAYEWKRGLDSSPWYVGQKVTVTATAGGGAPALNQPTQIISSIAYDTANVNRIVLTFANPLISTALANGNAYTNIVVKPFNVSPNTKVTLIDCNLVLKQLSTANMNINEPIIMKYNTYSTDQASYTNITNFQQTYVVEPNAKAVLCMFPRNGNAGGDSGLTSNNNNIQSWRLRVNNEDITDRDVHKKTPLAYDQLSITLNHLDYDLDALIENVGDTRHETDYPTAYANPDCNLIMIPSILPITQSPKNLQLNIYSTGTGVSTVYLYKALPVEIEI